MKMRTKIAKLQILEILHKKVNENIYLFMTLGVHTRADMGAPKGRYEFM